MKFRKMAALSAAATVLAVSAPMTAMTAKAEDSNVTVVRSLDGKTIEEVKRWYSRDLSQVPENQRSYTYKIDITGNIPAEGYNVDLLTLLFYNEEYTCDMTWTCGGKFQYGLPENTALYMFYNGFCGNDLIGLGGGAGGALIPSDLSAKFSSVSGDIKYEEGNYDHSSEQYKAYLEEYNSEWYQGELKWLESAMNNSGYDPEYREECRQQYEESKKIYEYPYSWYKLGSDKKSATLELGKAPDPTYDPFGLVKPELRNPYIDDEMLKNIKSPISDGPHFSFTVTTPGTIELTFKAKGADTKPGNSGSTKPGNNSDDKKTAITNKDASVTVNGVFPEGTKLNASIKKNDNGTYTADITPVDANGNKVQPDGAAVVMVPLPSEFKGKSVYVYRVEDGKYIGLQSWVDGDWLFYTTSHFSEFMLTTEPQDEANPNTGSAAAAGIAAFVLAGAFVIVSKKKR